ncbi:MAG: hypothetical protein JWQ72_1595, partial [Polaromonas sp.]|nr:hypothetical protein [Polaromonas sp.]
MQTVVGVFDTAADAEMAREELVRAGFSEGSVRVQSHAGTTGATTGTETSESEDTGGGFMSGVGHFFRDLFGGDDEHTGNYSEAVRRGSTVVAVTVSDESKVEEARAALAEAGAVDIDRRAETWREQGYTRFDPAASPYNNEQIAAERGQVLPVVREELEVGKRQVNLGAVRVFTRT